MHLLHFVESRAVRTWSLLEQELCWSRQKANQMGNKIRLHILDTGILIFYSVAETTVYSIIAETTVSFHIHFAVLGQSCTSFLSHTSGDAKRQRAQPAFNLPNS